MPFDPEIFGAPSGAPKDLDIFKDGPAAKQEVAASPQAVEQPPKGMFGYQMSPEQFAREKQSREQIAGWGKGVVKAAYEAGGKVTDATGSPLLGAITSVLPDIAQSMIGGEVGKVAAPAFEGTGRWLMNSALKPGINDVKRGRAAPAIETMLDAPRPWWSMPGYNPTTSGVEQMQGRISDLADQVKNSIAKSGAQIDVHSVADYVPQAYARFKNGPLAVSAIEDLGKVQNTLLDHPNVMGARTIPVQVAQDMKSGYQGAIGDKGYGVLKTPETEGEKQIARGLREKIADAVPNVAAPLAEESAMIRAMKIAQNTAAIDARKNPIGIWAAFGSPWMLPYWIWDRSAAGKALTARALYSGAENIPGGLGAGAGALSGAMQPGGVLSR